MPHSTPAPFSTLKALNAKPQTRLVPISERTGRVRMVRCKGLPLKDWRTGLCHCLCRFSLQASPERKSQTRSPDSESVLAVQDPDGARMNPMWRPIQVFRVHPRCTSSLCRWSCRDRLQNFALAFGGHVLVPKP